MVTNVSALDGYDVKTYEKVAIIFDKIMFLLIS